MRVGRRLAVAALFGLSMLPLAAVPARQVAAGPIETEPIETPAPAASVRESRAEPSERFVVAHQAYDDGEYQRAIELYHGLVREIPGNGYLHYNLGNAYLRNGELGRAIAAFRRARALLPRDEEVRANLEFARKSAKDAIAPPEPSQVATTLFFWHYELAREELAAIALLCNLLFWSGLGLLLVVRRWEPLRWLLIALLLPLLAAGGSLAVRTLAPQRVAVVVPQEVDAFTGPDAESVVRFKLHAGTELEIRDTRDGWVRIALPDGQQGWLQRDWVQVVEG